MKFPKCFFAIERSLLHPKRFQIIFPRVFGGHGAWRDLAVGRSLAEHFGEIAGMEFAAVRAAEDPAAGGEAGVGEFDEPVVVFFHTENFAFVVAGKGGRVEDDAVESAALSGESFEPVEGITFAEVMVGWVEFVCAEVVFCPIEVNLGKVECGGGGSAECGTDGECAGVGKGVEHGFSRGGKFPNTLSVQTLVEENALGVAGMKVDLVADTAFRGDKWAFLNRSGDVGWAYFFVLIELFPVGAMTLISQPATHFVGQMRTAG